MVDPALTNDPGRPVYARGGAVAAGQPLAASAGLEALARGGHAVDAALAMAAVTFVTMPEMCGLGGDAFALVYDASTRAVTAFNGSGGAPRAATIDTCHEAGHAAMPFYGWWSVAVPGGVGVYADVHTRYGRLPIADAWGRAIVYAREGVPIDPRLAANIAGNASLLAQDEATAAIYLAHGPNPPVGALLRNPALAESLEALVAGGAEEFYRGSLGRRIGEASRAAGGLLGPEDMAAHEHGPSAALCTEYRGHLVWETPPPSQGLILLEELSLLEGFDLTGGSPTDPEIVHLMVELKKLAFADRLATMGDPAMVDCPTDGLISRAYAKQRRAAFHPARVAEHPSGGWSGLDHTTSFVAVDADGNAVSFIHSISALFGAGVVAGDTGILMNNRAGRGFTLDESHPNALAPGKRTMHTLNTYLVTRHADGQAGAGDLVIAGNTPGGDGQPQWNFQAIVNALDFGLDAYGAIAAPRWTSIPGTDPITLGIDVELLLESRFPAETVAALEAKGHRVRTLGPWAGGGSAMMIRNRADGTLEAAADPRDGGQALGR